MVKKLALILPALIVIAFLVQPAFAPVNNAGFTGRARPVFEIDGVVYVDEAGDGRLEIGVVSGKCYPRGTAEASRAGDTS